MAYLALLIDDVVVNKFELTKDTTTIGRSSDNDIQIEDSAVSGRHAHIRMNKDDYMDGLIQYVIEDLGSTNSTKVNQTKVSLQQLFHNDLVEIGFNRFRFIDKTQVDLERTAVMLPDQED